jgi:uncharacterized protein (TIGR02421 family)
MTSASTLHDDDLAIDHELADVAQSFRFLLDVTPLDVHDARADFERDGTEPAFEYRDLEDDLNVVRKRLDAVPLEDIADPIVGHLLRAKAREVRLELDMLAVRDTPDFLTLSTELYGAVRPELLVEATQILDELAVEDPEPGPWVDAEEFVHLAELELARYREVHPDIEAHVEIRAGTSGVMVSNGDLLVAPSTRVPRDRVAALLHHEVGTHLLTHVNGSNQPLHVLATGLAGHDETQEGLAVLAEHLVGGLTTGRLRQLAARVVAVHQMTEGADFATVHRALVDAGMSESPAFTVAMRVFRCGGFTKDAIYLRGVRELIEHLGAGGDLEVLWLGKLSLTDVPLVEELRDRGDLVPPLLRPRYLDAPTVQERLAAVPDLPSLASLVGGPG